MTHFFRLRPSTIVTCVYVRACHDGLSPVWIAANGQSNKGTHVGKLVVHCSKLACGPLQHPTRRTKVRYRILARSTRSVALPAAPSAAATSTK